MHIKVAQSGFYEGFSKPVTIISKLLVLAFIVWVALNKDAAAKVLSSAQGWTTSVFGGWYMYVTAAFILVCLGLALYPRTGKMRLGKPDSRPEFSMFSWISMMFGAGIGIGMLTYSTAEPIFHFATNPDVIKGITEGETAGNVRSAYKWAFLHYGLSPWSIYGIIGLALGVFCHNRGLPLTIRSALRPLFGKVIDGPAGHIVDIAAILAAIIGMGVTLGFGVSQFASGIFNITGADWIMTDGKPSLVAQVLCLALVVFVSVLSAMSGVGKGIKWLSNINMGLSIFLLLFFAIFGASLFAFKQFFVTIWDYLLALPAMSLTVYGGGNEEAEALKGWQAGWTIFYWAWWIAFAPFVGLFLARVSKGRTVREFVLGAMVFPCLICLAWFVLIGGTAINLELSGEAKGAILGADISAQLFEMINIMLSPAMAIGMSAVIVTLLLTYLVTSADSAILIVTTVASGGRGNEGQTKHIVIWGILFALTVAVLLYANGLDALKSAMIIGALPFSIVMGLMAFALVKVLVFDRRGETL